MVFKRLIVVTMLFLVNQSWAQNEDPLTPERREAFNKFVTPHIVIDKGENRFSNTKNGVVYITLYTSEIDNQKANLDISQEFLKDLAFDASLRVEVVFLSQQIIPYTYLRKPGDKVQDVLSQAGGCDILNSLPCQDYHVFQNFRTYESDIDVVSRFNNTPIDEKKRWNLATLQTEMTLKVESEKISYNKKSETVPVNYCTDDKIINTYTVVLPKVLKEALTKNKKYHTFGLAFSTDCEENIVNIVESK